MPTRFLCLAGAFANDEKFKVQMAPFINEMESDGTADFYFAHGQHEANPPPGFEEFFGGPPFYRWMEQVQGPVEHDGLEKMRDFPQGASPEDTLRMFAPIGSSEALATTASQALDYVKGIIKEHGPFEAIIGYSEGAILAGTVIMREADWSVQGDYKNHFKLAMFFGGWPPLKKDLTGFMYSDETDEVIPIPVCNVIGSLDPYVDGSMALYNVCDPDTAVLFDHAKGHTLPRTKDTVKELGDTIRDMIREVREREQEQ
ncbi:hypothetical protein DPSP01_011457 [Paraphaeosphaeria sporulosa]|uniref:Serine hydrolase domain-containing protein n=1 Tax=Paraphaeosphaeria sporulosa TaxID=1460663 RepID=A0A177CXA4_9PLEO|nr:uncharacterized protein CC84DRAFT_1225444 [Paraphaeosphaeria sporulosa]OAG11831.1 hypothetical protein CC84DRAFT_1225444 [Paraphaeosphaeria sporulosa]